MKFYYLFQSNFYYIKVGFGGDAVMHASWKTQDASSVSNPNQPTVSPSLTWWAVPSGPLLVLCLGWVELFTSPQVKSTIPSPSPNAVFTAYPWESLLCIGNGNKLCSSHSLSRTNSFLLCEIEFIHMLARVRRTDAFWVSPTYSQVGALILC